MALSTATETINSRELPTQRMRVHGWRGEVVVDTPLHAWLSAGGRPDQIASPSDVVVRNGSRSRCLRIDRFDEDSSPLNEAMFFKVYRIRPGVEAWLKRRIGWHRPTWAWRLGWIINDAGINIAQPLGYLVPEPWRPERCSYYWTQWIEGEPAKDLAQQDARRELVAGSEEFAARAAQMLGRLHNAGVYHRDMNWGNVLVSQDQRLWLIDLDSAHRLTLHPRAAACRDVARFLMDAMLYETTRSWRQLFLEQYAQLRGTTVQRITHPVRKTMSMFYKRREAKWRRAGKPMPPSKREPREEFP